MYYINLLATVISVTNWDANYWLSHSFFVLITRYPWNFLDNSEKCWRQFSVTKLPWGIYNEKHNYPKSDLSVSVSNEIHLFIGKQRTNSEVIVCVSTSVYDWFEDNNYSIVTFLKLHDHVIVGVYCIYISD